MINGHTLEYQMKLDKIDREILASLQADCRKSRAELARTVGLTPTAVFERIRKLEHQGIIEGYSAKLNPVEFGKKLLAFVFVAERKPSTGVATGKIMAELEFVDEVHRITGKDCFLLKVRVEDTAELTTVLDKIGSVETVNGVETSVVVETLLEKPWNASLSHQDQEE